VVIGGLQHLLESFVDITARKRADEELRANRQMLRTTLDSLRDAVFVLSPEKSEILDCNRAALEMFGYSRDEMVGETVLLRHVDQHALEEFRRHLYPALADKGYLQQFEFRMKRKDGTIFSTSHSVTPLVDNQGQRTGWVSLIQDITERRNFEARLRLQAAALQAAHNGIVITDREGKILWVNQGFTTLTGYAPEEAIGQNPRVLKSGRHPQAFYQHLWETVLAGNVWHGELTNRRKNGIWYEEEMTITPVRNETGAFTHFIAIKQDITQRKQAQRYQDLSAEIMGSLNETLGVPEVVNQILVAIKRETGLDAVGIRLRSGDDFPYFVQAGLPPEFLLTENTLIARDKNGTPCRDENGNISLECTCGLVISGQTDPANPLFTEGGSFWTNNSSLSLELPAHQDPRFRPRNKCIHQGYGSVALIPIHARGDIVGLLQLNDRKQNCFSLEMIHFFEGISASIGVALMRKWQADALGESEAKLKEALLAAQMGVWEWTIATDTVTWDENLSRIAGRDPNLPAPGFQEQQQVYTPESWERLQAAVEIALKSGTPFELDLEMLRPDGSRRWLIARGEPLRDARGNITALRGTVQDITERRRSEKALRESEQFNREVIASAQEGVVVYDRELRYQVWNRFMEELTGVPASETLSKPALDLFPHLRAGNADLMIRRALAGEVVQSPDMPFRISATGRNGWVSSVYSPHYDASGEIVGAIGVIRDITERKLAEEALRENQEGLAAAQRIAHIGSWSWNLLTNTAQWSDETFRIFGLTPGQLPDHHQAFLDMVHPGDRMRVDQALSAAVTETGEYDLNYRIQLRDGTEKLIHAQAELLKDDAGKPLGLRGVAHDITERHRAETALQESEERFRSLFETPPSAFTAPPRRGRSWWPTPPW